MTVPWLSQRRGASLRLAVGLDRLVALLPSGDVRVVPLTSPLDLPDALAPVVAEAKPGATRIEWCLLPPLVDVRKVEAPRLRRDETTELLTRHARRYFPVVREEQSVGWRRIGKRSAVPAVLIAAAAPEAWTRTVAAAAGASGMALADPVPAHTAWFSAARMARPRFRHGAVAVAGQDRTHLLAVRGAVLTDVAVLPVGSNALGERLTTMAGGGGVVVLGSGPDVERLDPDDGAREFREPADVLAARFGGCADPDLALLTTSTRERRRHLERLAAARRWVVAAALVIAAALIEWDGMRRELDTVRAAREAIAVQVSKAMAERKAIETRTGAVATLDSLQATATDWSALLAALTHDLPDGAYLVTFRADSDSAAIDGMTQDASLAFAGLRDVPEFTGVAARGPIQREAGPSGPIERFAIAARLGRRGSP